MKGKPILWFALSCWVINVGFLRADFDKLVGRGRKDIGVMECWSNGVLGILIEISTDYAKYNNQILFWGGL
jgi:hypothetical protein